MTEHDLTAMTDTELDELNAGLTRERQSIKARQRLINAEISERQARAAEERKAAIEAGVHRAGALLGVGSPEPTRSVLGQPDTSTG